MKTLNPRFGFFTMLKTLLVTLMLTLTCAGSAAAQTVDEELRYDDGTPESTPISINDLIIVNRFTPPRYPATLKSVRIYLRRVNPTPVGTQIRLVVFGSTLSVPSVTFARPNFAYTQIVTVPDVSTTGEFVEFPLTSQIQISSGDVFVGFQQPAQVGAFFWYDTNEPFPMRSYLIAPNSTIVTNDFLPTGLPVVQPAVNFLIRVVLAVPTAQPPIAAVSAASYFPGDVAGESILAVFGANLAPAIATGMTVPLPTTLNGTTVKITDSANMTRDAGLFFVSPGQINLVLPVGAAEGAATMTVTNGGGQNFSTTINIRAVVPGVFNANANGQGVAAAELLRIRADGTQIYEPVARFDASLNQWVTQPIVFGPESEQAFLVLYGTGWRKRSDITNMRVNVQQASITQLPVLFAGPQGANVGLDQINATLPRTLAGKGEMFFRVIADGRMANLFKLNFQ
jgi:uncharacterized protein (TIGR03437 family)